MTTVRIRVRSVQPKANGRWQISGTLRDGGFGWFWGGTFDPWLASICRRGMELDRDVVIGYDRLPKSTPAIVTADLVEAA